MLARYERGAPPGSLPVAGPSGSGQVNGIHHEPSELEKELEETRESFDAYQREMGIDTVKLREEVAQYQRETRQLSTTLAKANAKIEFLNGTCQLVLVSKVWLIKFL